MFPMIICSEGLKAFTSFASKWVRKEVSVVMAIIAIDFDINSPECLLPCLCMTYLELL